MRKVGRIFFGISAFVWILYAAFIVAIVVVKPMGIQNHIIKGESMLPTIKDNDLAIAVKVSFGDVEVGDIIIFSSYSGKRVVHRVIQVVRDENTRRYGFITKGDGNKKADPFVPSGSLVAKSIFVIPQGGYLMGGYAQAAFIVLSVFLLITTSENRLKERHKNLVSGPCENGWANNSK